MLCMVGIYFLAGHLQWVRMMKVDLATLGSGRGGLVQVLSRKRMVNRDGGIKGARAPL